MAKELPRLLIEEWLPAAAIGVECMRERGSASALAPHTYLHVWWARRPLTVSRAAVLASLLPADFPRDIFEQLLGFWGKSSNILEAQELLDRARALNIRIPNPHEERAFKAHVQTRLMEQAHEAMRRLWNDGILVIDPMAGGGSIPLEAARLGLRALANEYNPVACSILEATVDYPFRFGEKLAQRARRWGSELRRRFNLRMERFFAYDGFYPPHTYIFARTVPCPDTHKHTPLVPDWHLLKPAGAGRRVVAEPVVNKKAGTWSVRIREIGRGSGQLKDPPLATYKRGKGVSLLTTTPRQIPGDYIKAMAQDGKMKSALYAIALKTNDGLQFRLPEPQDLKALSEAEEELQRLRPEWEKANLIPTEMVPIGDKTGEPMARGIKAWSDMFTPRQLLSMGTLVEELNAMRPEILKSEGKEFGEAVVHMLACALDKYLDYNNSLTTWESTRGIAKHLFQRHDFSFKATFAEMAPCNSGTGVEWTIDKALSAYEDLSRLPRHSSAGPVDISLGSATNLPQIPDKSITAVVIDPPYADNVQYSELADFFYVWLKRTQGHRRPEWFATYLCEHDQEAVVNLSRFKDGGGKQGKNKPLTSTGEARMKAHAFYQSMMTDTFRECRRILRDDGALTVMFTHKKQEAWERPCSPPLSVPASQSRPPGP